MRQTKSFKIFVIGAFIMAACAAAVGDRQKSSEVQEPRAKRNVDELYSILSSQIPEKSEITRLFSDVKWKPSDVDVAKAIQDLPSFDQDSQALLLILLSRDPQKSLRWSDVLVDRIVRDNPTDDIYPMYIQLLSLASEFKLCGRLHPCLARLWKAADLRVTELWAEIAAERNIGDWRTDFRDWKARLSKADQERFGRVIAEVEALAARKDPNE